MSDEDFNGILSKWQKLKILDLSEFKAEKSQSLILTNEINLKKALPLLEKIIAEPNDRNLTALDDFGDVPPNYQEFWTNALIVKKIWIDPKDVQAPIKLENIFWLELSRYHYPYLDHFPEAMLAKMQEIGPKMKNLENLDVAEMNQGNLLKGIDNWSGVA